MQCHYPSINAKQELQILKKIGLVLDKFDEKIEANNNMKVNFKAAEKNIDNEMEKYKLLYKIKDLRVILHRIDEKPVSTVNIDTIKKNINDRMIKPKSPVYHNHVFLPFAVDKNGQYCSICTMEYTEKKKLFDHIKRSLEDSLFRCEICNIAIPRDSVIIDLEKDWTNRVKCSICSVIF